MSANKGYLNFLYRNNAEMHMFWYVRGVRQVLPSVSVYKAIVLFVKDTGHAIIPASAEVTYHRINSEYIAFLKQQSKDETENG